MLQNNTITWQLEFQTEYDTIDAEDTGIWTSVCSYPQLPKHMSALIGI